MWVGIASATAGDETPKGIKWCRWHRACSMDSTSLTPSYHIGQWGSQQEMGSGMDREMVITHVLWKKVSGKREMEGDLGTETLQRGSEGWRPGL